MHQRRHAIVVLPRARKVHQSLLTTPPTFLYSLLVALWHITLAPALQGSAFSDVLLLNGPGTCVVVAACVWIGRVSVLRLSHRRFQLSILTTCFIKVSRTKDTESDLCRIICKSEETFSIGENSKILCGQVCDAANQIALVT